MQAALDGLMSNRTTVVVAHRLSTVMGADKIAVVKRGRVVEEGTHAELIERAGAYNLLVQMQQTDGSAAEAEEEDEEAQQQEQSEHMSTIPEVARWGVVLVDVPLSLPLLLLFLAACHCSCQHCQHGARSQQSSPGGPPARRGEEGGADWCLICCCCCCDMCSV